MYSTFSLYSLTLRRARSKNRRGQTLPSAPRHWLTVLIELRPRYLLEDSPSHQESTHAKPDGDRFLEADFRGVRDRSSTSRPLSVHMGRLRGAIKSRRDHKCCRHRLRPRLHLSPFTCEVVVPENRQAVETIRLLGKSGSQPAISLGAANCHSKLFYLHARSAHDFHPFDLALDS